MSQGLVRILILPLSRQNKIIACLLGRDDRCTMHVFFPIMTFLLVYLPNYYILEILLSMSIPCHNHSSEYFIDRALNGIGNGNGIGRHTFRHHMMMAEFKWFLYRKGQKSGDLTSSTWRNVRRHYNDASLLRTSFANNVNVLRVFRAISVCENILGQLPNPLE